MKYYINEETLFTTFSSCNCSIGYLFVKDEFPIVNELIGWLCPGFSLSNVDFNIGLFKWSPLASSCSIVTQKLSHTSTLAFIYPLLSEIELLIVDEACLSLISDSSTTDNNYNIVVLKSSKSSIQA